MHSGTSLRGRLKAFFEAIDKEASQNPAFAAQLSGVFGDHACDPVTRNRPTSGHTRVTSIPDVFKAMQEKGEEEFRFWLRSLDIPTLRAIVKRNGFDPARASQRWKDSDKFIALVSDQTLARLKRGSAFLPPKAQNPTPE